MFDPNLSTKAKTGKAQKTKKAVAKPQVEEKPYKVIRDLNGLKIFESLEDSYAVLKDAKLTIQEHEFQHPFADLQRYLTADEAEVDQLWEFKKQEIQMQQANIEEQMQYKSLLQEIYQSLQSSSTNIDLPDLNYHRQGSTRVKINNFGEICESLKRDTDSVSKFLAKTFDTEAGVTADVLSLKKSLPKDQIVSAILSYRKEYIQCASCGGMNTMIVKSEGAKDIVLSCNDCLAQRHLK